MYLAMKLRIARSVCGLNTMGMSARSKQRCSNVERTATLTCGALKRRSVTRVHKIGCISAMFEPILSSGQGTFDTIILISVFEHLSHPQQVLADCYALLKDGGKLILSTPDSTYFKYLYFIRKVLRMEPWSNDHISFFSPKNLQRATIKNGFETVSASFHSLVTPDSAECFGKVTNSVLVKWAMNLGRYCGVDKLFKISTIFLILSKPSKA
jgi:SAM-dependent methyltransferase